MVNRIIWLLLPFLLLLLLLSAKYWLINLITILFEWVICNLFALFSIYSSQNFKSNWSWFFLSQASNQCIFIWAEAIRSTLCVRRLNACCCVHSTLTFSWGAATTFLDFLDFAVEALIHHQYHLSYLRICPFCFVLSGYLILFWSPKIHCS